MTGLAAKAGLDIGTKVLAIAGGVTTVALAAALAFVTISKNAEIRTLDSSINHPVTGYKVTLERAQSDLATCRTNRITLEEAAASQSAAVAAARAESEARLQALSGQLDTARRASATAQRRADAILAARPTDDQCASADALILENSR